MKRLVLKYSMLFGADPLPEIETRARKLGLSIDKIEEIKNNPHSSYRIVSLSGDVAQILRLDQDLVRTANVIRKLI